MVGRTRLYQRTGSPLIQGRSRRRALPLWAIVALVLVAVVLITWALVAFLR